MRTPNVKYNIEVVMSKTRVCSRIFMQYIYLQNLSAHGQNCWQGRQFYMLVT